MKAIVLGSGVIGLTSAWYLAKAGYEVCVVDRQLSSGQETSFANAGQISYGYSSPWAAPGVPIKAIKWLMQRHAPLVITPSLSTSMLSWMAKLSVNCQQRHYEVNKSRMLRLANYSRQCLAQLRHDTQINYQGRQLGTLQVFRDVKQVDAIEKDIALLRDSGIEYALLDQQQCVVAEPALARVEHKIVGGLRLPQDETGDCALFCQALTTLAKQAGVKFSFGTDVMALIKEGDKIRYVQTSAGKLYADKVVVALGCYSNALLSPLGIHLPVYPVKGYSLTMPIIDKSAAPLSTVMDETYKVAITRFDDRIRVAGTAHLTGFDLSVPASRTKTISMVVNDLFPAAGDLSQASYWSGLRPMTPDGTPIIGKTSIDNLYLNTGHGTLGWTMACGSAKLLSDIMAGKKTDIDNTGLDISRY